MTSDNDGVKTLRAYHTYGFKSIRGNIIHSMSLPWHCFDNSPIESFCGIFKSEFVYNFKTREEAIKDIEMYFKFYNNIRIILKVTTLIKKIF